MPYKDKEKQLRYMRNYSKALKVDAVRMRLEIAELNKRLEN